MKQYLCLSLTAAGLVTGGVIACTGDDPVAASPSRDAGSADQDAAIQGVGGACDLAAPFLAPRSLPGVPRMGFSLSPDEQTVYWGNEPISDGGIDGATIVFAIRSDRNANFGSAYLLNNADPDVYDFYPRVSNDAKSLLFSRRVGGSAGAGGTPVVARRNSTGDHFGTVKPVTGLDRVNGDVVNAYSLVGSDVVWFSTVAGVILRGQIVANTLTNVTPVAGLGTNHFDTNPVVTADELTMFFASDRDGSKGRTDIWMATRASATDPFGNLKILAELNSALDDLPEWVSPDGCTLYYSVVTTDPEPGRYAEHPRN